MIKSATPVCVLAGMLLGRVGGGLAARHRLGGWSDMFVSRIRIDGMAHADPVLPVRPVRGH